MDMIFFMMDLPGGKPGVKSAGEPACGQVDRQFPPGVGLS